MCVSRAVRGRGLDHGLDPHPNGKPRQAGSSPSSCAAVSGTLNRLSAPTVTQKALFELWLEVAAAISMAMAARLFVACCCCCCCSYLCFAAGAPTRKVGRDVNGSDSMFRFLMSTAPVVTDPGNETTRRRRMQTTVGTEPNTGSLYDTGCFETREGGSWYISRAFLLASSKPGTTPHQVAAWRDVSK